MSLEKIVKIAKKVGISEDNLELYGNYKAKINYSNVFNNDEKGKLILVTAITPTKAGEGKTTTSIALLDGLAKIDKKAILCLREPSLGPTFGLKGGATGGGKVTVEPSMDINLHFTGDMHALTSSINLISAVIDNHIYQGNELNIDPNKIVWRRAIDMNDRELRNIEIGLGSKTNGIIRNEHFEITVASELMAILCLCKDEEDFLKRINKIIIAYTFENKPVFLEQLHISNSILLLMKEALKPNLVQTQENNPVLIHGGPFANIAHGCCSIISTKLALKLAPIVIEEAGFGADLGAEKFFDIKCRTANLKPSCAVLVVTIRALKLHGGVKFENLEIENVESLKVGIQNLEQHYQNLRKFGLPVIVAINHFNSDSESEIRYLKNRCYSKNYKYAFLDGYECGGDGSIELAKKVCEVLDTTKPDFEYLYNIDLPIKEKILKIVKEIYRGKDIAFTEEAEKKIKSFEGLEYEKLPVCMAKTPQSFSDDAKLLNCPRGFSVTITDIKIANGAGFIIVYCGNIMTMPGLPKVPNAQKF